MRCRHFLAVGFAWVGVLFPLPLKAGEAPGGSAPAAREALPEGATVTRLVVHPSRIELRGPFAYAQVLVTAQLSNGETADVTRLAHYELPQGLTVDAGLIRPQRDVQGTLTIRLGNQSVQVPVQAVQVQSDPPVSFVADVQPVLSKLGCNAGTCHGAAQGKNGFKLSLRGYDPLFDYRSLTDDLEGRRFNRAAPEKSLMLMKPAGVVPHQGGVLLQLGDPNYELIRRWIAQGVRFDPQTPRVRSIEVYPKNPTIYRIGQKQQFAVYATYSDGRVRDVTAEAFLESSNTEVATVSPRGLAQTLRRGEATLLARYEGAYAASTLIVLGDRTGFEWIQRPVHNFIDELVDAKLKKVRVQVSPLASDEEFLRRVYLDLTGLPPTSAEVRAFLADPRDSRVKRDEVIDRLIGSEAFIEHWTNKWADLLMVNRKFLGEAGAAAYRQWIREAIATNMPYDRFAYTILTASGSNLSVPPASYHKILRTPDALMENTTQLFLAIRFNCNKCHDHPFERWTQDDYYGLAAYFARTKLSEDPKYKGQRIGGSAVEGAKPLVEIVADAPDGEVRHERTGQIAAPRFPFSVPVSLSPQEPRRVQLAKWITSPQNPYFAKSYVNRLWSYLLGVGLIEPVDDIRAGNPPTNPELLDRLTEEFIRSGFDTRHIMRLICKSRTYQLSVETNRWNKDDEINYSHALPRRLPAEVLFDSIHRVTGAVSRLPGLPPGARAAQLLDSNVEVPGGFFELFSKPPRESPCECERSNTLNLGPILAMVNGPIIGEALRDPNNRLNQFVLQEKDDAKVVEEIYLSVLNRRPTPAELQAGIKALHSADADHKYLVEEYLKRKAAFEAYEKTIPQRQKAWEAGLLAQKPTQWVTLDIRKAASRQGPYAQPRPGATLTVQPDGSILASGNIDSLDIYTLVGLAETDQPITAIRLEVLSDPSLPSKGPGRAPNGNFVLTEFRLRYHRLDQPDGPQAIVRLTAAAATFQQDGFPLANTLDNNRATGWAIAPQTGRDQAALFRLAQPISGPAGVAFTIEMEQHYQQAAHHTLGKFRLSYTTDPNPRLSSPLTPEQLALLETPEEKRTPEQKARLRQMYLAQDQEYQRLAAEAAKVPPPDPRVVGAQDLVWALINTPAFLFNH
ncbi:DUF1549 domain-containing protein [Thermogemmata fonticola]|uniref:DUF1553 domain-containing protein n=1 Tax=Thermogemmata fonticola TaxID=2755323 RepID=A0A7V8VH73_9BACT|nr:DUF1549 domain-containing protein [Thermogemmata fonticola]MBA2227830.1 DUF1553 domain-containing protein [Thermogemmata fonticola]